MLQLRYDGELQASWGRCEVATFASQATPQQNPGLSVDVGLHVRGTTKCRRISGTITGVFNRDALTRFLARDVRPAKNELRFLWSPR